VGIKDTLEERGKVGVEKNGRGKQKGSSSQWMAVSLSVEVGVSCL